MMLHTDPPSQPHHVQEVLDGFDAHQIQLEKLCARLELIADLLPDHVDPTLAKFINDNILDIVKSAQQFEENELFPLLRQQNAGETSLTNLLADLLHEHYEDVCLAEEVREALTDLIHGTPHQTANATGYMLRGFFDKLRRHMSYERHLTAPLRTKKAPGKPDAL